jgi:hypothetical protein
MIKNNLSFNIKISVVCFQIYNLFQTSNDTIYVNEAMISFSFQDAKSAPVADTQKPVVALKKVYLVTLISYF